MRAAQWVIAGVAGLWLAWLLWLALWLVLGLAGIDIPNPYSINPRAH